MRKYRKLGIVVLLLVLAAFPIMYYQPVKEGKVYQREVDYIEEADLEETGTQEDQVIEKARESLEELLEITIGDEYTTKVNFETIEVSNYRTSYKTEDMDVVRVTFYDSDSGDTIYTICFDTTSGEILDLSRHDEPTQTEESTLGEEDLEEAALEFVEKILDTEEEDMLVDSRLEEDTFVVTIRGKVDFQPITVYLNAENGDVIFYLRDY